MKGAWRAVLLFSAFAWLTDALSLGTWLGDRLAP